MLRKHVGNGIDEAIRLIAHQRGHRRRRFREVIEAELWRAVVDRIVGNAVDAKVLGYRIRKCEVVQRLRAVPRKNKLRVVDPASRQILCKTQGYRLAVRGHVALKVGERLEGVIGRLAEAIEYARVQLRRDAVQEPHIKPILLRGHLRLQMEIIDDARKARLGNILQQSERGGIQRRGGNLAANGCARPGEIRGIGNIEPQLWVLIAEISRPFRQRGHGRKLVHGIARPGAVKIHEEKCLIVPIINVRNHQRPAEISADSFAPGWNFGCIGLRERIGARVQHRIAVLVVETGPDPIDSLPQNALHAEKRRYAPRRRAAASWSGPASALRSKCDHGPVTRAPARQARSTCAAGIAYRSSAVKGSACSSKAVLARIARPLQNDTAWRKTRAEAGVLIPAAHGAVHEESVGRGCLPERPLIVGCCALRLLPGLSLLSLFASLIVEVHLLEAAATRC